MIFNSVHVTNYRSIEDSGLLPLGPITVLIGQNNSGKSALIRAVYSIQEGAPFKPSDIRIGASVARVNLGHSYLPLRAQGGEFIGERLGTGVLCRQMPREGPPAFWSAPTEDSTDATPVTPPSSARPNHLVHPVLSNRFQNYSYEQQATISASTNVWPHDGNLVARVSAIAAATHAEGRRFRDLCERVLNITFEGLDTDNGPSRQIGVTISMDDRISLEAMGSGLGATLNLLVTLSTAKRKLILVEEPETDLHPHALKILLDAIIESSTVDGNQFIVSTHSSIVLVKLGAAPDTVLIHTRSDGGLPPATTYDLVELPSDRLRVLSDLGYDFADLMLGSGWLILEESSAQSIIQSFLAPTFAPGLLGLRIISANSETRVKPILDSYKEMFLFAHLEKAYWGRAWAIVDGGSRGASIIDSLREMFPDWPPEHFRQWNESDFERYYPKAFSAQVEAALFESHSTGKQEKKHALTKQVLDWIAGDRAQAEREFALSAREVIDKLQQIESQLAELRPFLGPSEVLADEIVPDAVPDIASEG